MIRIFACCLAVMLFCFVFVVVSCYDFDFVVCKIACCSYMLLEV